MLASFLSGEFLLHLPCWLYFSVGSFIFTSHAGFIFLWEVFLTHPILASFSNHLYAGSFSYTSCAVLISMEDVPLIHPMQVFFFFFFFFLSSEFHLHIPCCLGFYISTFFYTSRAGFCFLFVLFYRASSSYKSHACVNFTLGVFAGLIFMWEVSLTHPVLFLFLSGESLKHPMLLYFSLGSFSYTSKAGINLIWGVSLTYPLPASFYVGSFSYTSRSAFNFISWFLLHIPCWLHFYFCFTHPMLVWYPMLVWFYCGEFLLHTPCWLLFLIWGVSLTHPVLFSFSSAESLLYIFLLHFYVGNFSYTSHTDFFFIWGVSLTQPVVFIWGVSLIHPMPASILSGEFLLHIQCWLNFLPGDFVLHIRHWLYFSVGSFSYTSRAGFIFIGGVSLTHPMLALILCGEFLLHIPCWLDFFFFFFFFFFSFFIFSGVTLTHPCCLLFFF